MLERQPVLDHAGTMVVEAWGDLCTERQVGMAVGPIPASEIRAWARDNRLDFANTQLLVTVIRRLDRDYLERESSKRAHQSPKGK